MPDVSGLRRRLVALAAAAACLVLIAPPAAGDGCCAQDCNDVCCLLVARAGLGRHHHHGGEGGPRWATVSAAQDCATACPPSASGRGLGAAPAAAWSAIPAAAGALSSPFATPPETARPARTADPRGPPPASPSIAV